MTYHAIGDSNCLYSFFHLPDMQQHHLGSVRMRDVVARGLDLLDIRKLGIAPGDKCFFNFGEIDVRCDFCKAVRAGTDEKLLIADLVQGYMAVLKANVMEGVEFWIVAVLPSARADLLPPEVRDHPLYPFVGTDYERAGYTIRLNAQLLEAATSSGLRFLDVFTGYAGANGMLRPELASYMHVADNRPILEAMQAAGLYPEATEAGTPMSKILDRFQRMQ